MKKTLGEVIQKMMQFESKVVGVEQRLETIENKLQLPIGGQRQDQFQRDLGKASEEDVSLEKFKPMEKNQDKLNEDLAAAASEGNVAETDKLLALGANVNSTSSGKNPLHWAAQGCHEKVAERLLNAEAQVDAKDEGGRTPLHWAARSEKCKKLAELLVKAGAKVSATDQNERTPVEFAGLSMAKTLVKLGKLDNKLDEDLAAAASEGNVAETDKLLALGAKVNSTSSGKTPLHWAAQGCHEKVAERLLNAEAQVDAKDEGGRTPLHWAARSEKCKKLAELLVKAGAKVSATDQNERTPVEFAGLSMAKTLVKLGKLDNKLDEDLAAAASEGNVAETDKLLALGAKVNSTSSGKTPLHWAAQGCHEKVAERLLNAEAQVDAKDEGGRTPLHWAARSEKCKKLAELLVKAGANVSATDQNGRTPAIYAQK